METIQEIKGGRFSREVTARQQVGRAIQEVTTMKTGMRTVFWGTLFVGMNSFSELPPMEVWDSVVFGNAASEPQHPGKRSDEDSVVPFENSLTFAAALSENKGPFDRRIYDRGKQGPGPDTPCGWEENVVSRINRLRKG